MLYSYLIGGLLGACGLLFGLWQRSRASSLSTRNTELLQQNALQRAQAADTEKRYQAVIAQKEAELEQFRKEIDALPPSALINRFNSLFPPKTHS